MEAQLNSQRQKFNEPWIKSYQISCPLSQILMILFLLPLFCNSTCPISATLTPSIYYQQDKINPYSTTITYGVAISSVFEYYMYYVNYQYTAILKTDYSGTPVTAAFSVKPIKKSLFIDPSGFDSFLYFAGLVTDMPVIKVNCVDLSIMNIQVHSTIQGERDDIQVHYKSDATGYYIVACGGTNAIVCYYIFPSSTSEKCQEISNINQYAYGQLKLTDISLFFLGADPGSLFSLHFYNIEYDSSLLGFKTKWSCTMTFSPTPTSSTAFSSQSISISSSIYSFFISSVNSSSTKSLYLASFDPSGNPGVKFKFNYSCDSVNGAATDSSVIMATALCYTPSASYNLIVYNITANNFIIKKFTGNGINGCGIDSMSRFIVTGAMGSYGYTTKFGISDLNNHPDFTLTSSLSTISLTESISLDNPSSHTSFPSSSFTVSLSSANVNQLSAPTYCYYCTSGSGGYLSSNCSTSSGGTTTNSSTTTSGGSTSSNSSTSGNKTSDISSNHSASQFLSIIACVAVSISVSVTSIMSLFNSAFMTGAWSMINQVQLFFLLLLTRAFIPTDVKLVIIGFKLTVNMPQVIHVQDINLSEFIENNFDFNLSYQPLEDLGIQSDSTIYNFNPTVMLILIMIPLHLLIVLFRRILCMPKENDDSNCCIRFIRWSMNKLFIILTFGCYIRYLLGMNQFALISTIYEVYKFNTSERLKIVSLVFAIFALCLCFCLIIVVISLSLSSYAAIEEKHNKIEELFSGVRMEKKSKMYVAVQLIRRAIFVTLLITLISIKSWILISIISVIQLCYTIYVIIQRPFIFVKENLIEIINEIYFFVLLTGLIHFNLEEDWNFTYTSVYMWVITSNTLVIMIIILIDMFKKLIIKLMNCCSKSQESSNKISPITNSQISAIIAQRDPSFRTILDDESQVKRIIDFNRNERYQEENKADIIDVRIKPSSNMNKKDWS